MRNYSPIFQTIYDQESPIGDLGNGLHYSVLRFVNKEPLPGSPSQEKRIVFRDFAVLWDEDHDTRVIEVAERLFKEDLLENVLVLQETKGSIILWVDLVTGLDNSFPKKAYAVVENLDLKEGDHFSLIDVFVLHEPEGIFESPKNGFSSRKLFDTEGKRTHAYLIGVDALWQLGKKTYALYTKPQEHLRSGRPRGSKG